MTIVASTKLFKPCHFNSGGATKEYCTSVSGLPIRRKQACGACPCPFKVTANESSSAKEQPRARAVSLAHTGVSVTRSAVQESVAVPSVTLVPVVRATSPQVAKLPPSQTKTTVKKTAEEEQVITPSPNPEERWRTILKRIEIAMADAEYVKVDPAVIRPMPGQPRDFFDEGALQRLEVSIREVGQVQTGIIRRVTDGESGVEYELLDGERRWRVVSRIGKAPYRAMLVRIDDEAAPFIVATISNFNRADHTPLELATAIRRLREGLNMPMEVIADMHGIKPFWAYQLQGLTNLHAEVKDLLDPRIMKDKECMPVTAAIHISKLDPALQPDLSRRFMNGDITLRGLRSEILRVGNEHGMPVRQRASKPSHQFDSFVAMGRNLASLSHDLQALCNREDFTTFIRGRDPGKVANVQRALVTAEDQIFKCKRLIAKALSNEKV